MAEFDGRRAAAEAQLERIDDRLADDTAEGGDGVVVATDEVHDAQYGFHLDDPDGGVADDVDLPTSGDPRADALDVVAEAFNARDMDGLLDVVAADGEAPGLLSYERGDLPAAIQDLWQRRPSCCLGRGHVDDEPVGVLWEHDGDRWWEVAVVHVDDVDDGVVGVLEFGDDPALLEQVEAEPPDGDLEEGTRWSEWEDGAD